jgi:hypothetical protein
MIWLIPFIKGFAVGTAGCMIFPTGYHDWRWWVWVIAMNVAVGLPYPG